MFQTQEEIANMLRHAIRRCAGICRNLKQEPLPVCGSF